MITVIGIGMEKGDLTQKAAKKIASAQWVWLRSQTTAAGEAVCREYPHVRSLDELYAQAESFDVLRATVCDKLLAEEAAHGEVVYLTDGDGVDGCVAELRRRGVRPEMIYGVAPYRTRGADESALRLPAAEALARKPYLDTELPLHLTEIDDKYLAGDLKLWLMSYYGDETQVTVYCKRKQLTIPLCELDRLQGYDYSCEAYIAAQAGFAKEKYGFGDLLRIMARLTAPDGCPWDGAQTHESIRVNMIEEAYEAVDAIDGGNIDDMVEEFGDVLLQAVFHCDMGERFGEFTLADVLGTLCRKLVTRHTHIFGEHKAKDADEALGFWEAAKSEEKSYVSVADKLQRLPEGFPSLLAAQKAYKKLTKAGLSVASGQWERVAGQGDASDESQAARRLFALTALLADNGVDAEVALNAFVARLKRDFAAAEQAGDTADFLREL